ncbi:alkaline phosphatase D family protein [Pseudobdellovibrio sp. HCB154]|uniref:alkaline phosphatase D family protein n=1 Tax=Pseudobdellovibrio sp. HCB154 TaxID=3386277 RepID=UPI003917528E
MKDTIISYLHGINNWLQKAHLKNVMRIIVSLAFFFALSLVLSPIDAQKEGWLLIRFPLLISIVYATTIELLTRLLPPNKTKDSDIALPTLGPFLCRATPKSIGFWMCFDHNVKSLNIEVFENGKHITTATGKIVDVDFNTWLAETLPTALTANTTYTYIVKVDEKEYSTSWAKDFKFKTQSDERKESAKIISMSCHGIDAWEKANGQAKTWNMWSKALDRVQNDNIELCVLGGDQVYMDETFERYMKKYKKLDQNKRFRMIKQTYHQFWSNPAYQQTLAQVPSILMWDDHDLNDGFGSRSDSFKGNELNEHWTAYKVDLSKAFFAFQAVRNPGQNTPSSNYSFKLDTSNYSIIAFDLRSERNSKRKEMLSSASKKKVEQFLLSENDSPLFLLSPVTVTRINANIEATIGNLANAAWGSWKILGHGVTFKKVLAWNFVFLIIFLALQITEPNISAFLSSGLFALMCFFYLAKSFFDSSFDFKQIRKILRWSLLGVGVFYTSIAAFGYYPHINLESLPIDVHKFILENIFNIKLLLSTMIIAQVLTFTVASKETKPNWLIKAIKLPSIFLTYIIFFWYGLPGDFFGLDTLIKFPVWLCSLLILTLSFAEAAHIIDEVAGLDDDVKDSWSSETNENELRWLLTKISLIKRSTVLLCGDIHTGGYSNIKINKNNKNIPQITSSPISYPPMESLVEKLTTGAKKAKLPMTEPLAMAENVFFLSERNFVVVEITKSGQLKAEYIFEDHDLPVKILADVSHG